MKFLIDNNLSPQVAVLLGEAGHDAVHVRDYGMRAAPDARVLDRARAEERVLISADTDFGMLLSRLHRPHPRSCWSVGLWIAGPRTWWRLILANLGTVLDDLEVGAIVVLGDDSVRIRRLPI